MEEYSFKRKSYVWAAILTCIVSLFLVGIYIYPSWILMLYMSAIVIYLVAFSITFVEIYVRQFIYYTFTTENPWWKKEIDRPRLLLLTFSIGFVGLSYLCIIKRGVGVDFGIFVLSGGLAFVVGVLLFILSRTDNFEKIVIAHIRTRLYSFLEIKCIINTEKYNIPKILDALPKLDTSPEIFKIFIQLKEIQPHERIITKYSKSDLIRFCYVFFNLKDIDPKYKEELINKYFIDTEGNDLILKNEATFSRIDREILNSSVIYTNFKNSLTSVFESNKH